MGLKLRTLYILLGISIVILITGIVLLTVNYSAPDTTTDTSYKLTHSAADAEYILSWDEIVSRCPDIDTFDKMEAFVRRGETSEFAPGEPFSLAEDSPAAWANIRGVRTKIVGNSFRSFGVWIMYYETAEELDEHVELMKMSGIPFQEEGDFVTAVLESGPPMQSVQLHIAGNQFCILFTDIASSDKSLFFGKEKLMELLPIVKSNISSLEITALPSDIPERKPAGEAPYEWHEFMTFRSDELPPPVPVSEGEWYNNLIFSDRPLMQGFSFTIDKDWRFVMTATGEIGTKFELFPSVLLPGEQQPRQIGDHVFSLHSDTVTITREQSLGEEFEPPVNIEIKVFFDSPISWTFTVEK